MESSQKSIRISTVKPDNPRVVLLSDVPTGIFSPLTPYFERTGRLGKAVRLIEGRAYALPLLRETVTSLQDE